MGEKIGLSGGDKMNQRLAEIAAKLKEAGSVNIGFLEGATYPDGKGVPFVAAMNEFGVPSHGQPPRPFFRGMIKEKSPDWGDGVAKALKAHDYHTQEALQVVGEGIAGQLRDSITKLDSPALAPSTIARKGSSKPLIDTGHMLNSVDYEVLSK